VNQEYRIEVKGLYKIFGKRIDAARELVRNGKGKEEILKETGCTVGIDNASFKVRARETFVVMGLSGSGKSTVIRCLNRLIRPTDGEILLDGDDVAAMNRQQLQEMRQNKMSMVFQNFGLLPHRNVLKNTEYGLEISGVDKEIRSKKAFEALELVGLKGYEQSMPSELSGGMKQRVGLARALANDPEVLLMDEAFSALDPLIRTQMQDELLDLQTNMHKTIIFITHDLDEALKLGDRIAIMKDGRIVQIGTPEQILTNPADDYVRAFVQNVDNTRVITASAIARKCATINLSKDGPHVAVRVMEKSGKSSVYALNDQRELQGLVKIDDALALEKQKKDSVESKLIKDVFVTDENTAIGDLLSTALEAKYPIVVQNARGKMTGIIDRATLLAEIMEMRGEIEGGPVLLSDQD
jgi:glycine betaine/proline transport system ATP-binding protein